MILYVPIKRRIISVRQIRRAVYQTMRIFHFTAHTKKALQNAELTELTKSAIALAQLRNGGELCARLRHT